MNVLRRNNVTILGRGQRTMIFAHGYGCDLTAWNAVTAAFAADWRLVLFDHVGAGGSDLSAYNSIKYGSLSGYAADVLEILAALGEENTVFVGHSMGAIVGMLAAIQEPKRFSDLVMVCPSPCFLNFDDYTGGFTREDLDGLIEVLDANFLGWSRAMAPAIMGNPGRPELGETLVSSFCRTDPDIARDWARVVFLSDHRADVPHCTTRTLVLQTGEDLIAPVAVGEWMNAHLPHSEYRLMAATGHCPHMSAPEETAEAMRAFLTQSARL